MPSGLGSSLPAPAALAVSGDVGFLADENAQRLVSIYIEDVSATLQCLRETVEAHLKGASGACVQTTFERGLAVLRQCSADSVAEQVAALQARYPETEVLHRYVLVSLLSEAAYAEGMHTLLLPSVAETYHAFTRRVASHPDVQQTLGFLQQPLAARRVVFLDAFRNAMHDQARRCIGRQPLRAPEAEPPSASKPGRLTEAVQAAKARSAASQTSSRGTGSSTGEAAPPEDPTLRAVMLHDTPVPPGPLPADEPEVPPPAASELQ